MTPVTLDPARTADTSYLRHELNKMKESTRLLKLHTTKIISPYLYYNDSKVFQIYRL